MNRIQVNFPSHCARIAARRLGLLAAALLMAAGTAQAAPTFTWLGDSSGRYSYALGVSADGSTVVGYNTFPTEAFRWTSASGMVGLGANSLAFGVSADGSTVVGYRFSASPTEAFRWTSAGGMVGLGFPAGAYDSAAHGVSADGSTVVGHGGNPRGFFTPSTTEAFRWTSAGGMVGLGHLWGGSSYAQGVSADGSTVVGYNAVPARSEAFRWTSAGGMVGLGYLAGADSSYAQEVSADGSTVVGYSTMVGYNNAPARSEAFRWTSAGGMVGLGDLTGGSFVSYASGVSADGSTVVGNGTSASGPEAFVWDSTNGMRLLQDVLVNNYGLYLGGPSIRLFEASGISGDGQVISGYGTTALGNIEAWVVSLRGAQVSEPGVLVSLGLGALLMIGAMRRRLGRAELPQA